MNWKTWIPLVLAVGLALVAAKLTHDVIAGKKAKPEENAQANFVQVVVARGDLPPGATLTKENLTLAPMPGSVAPAHTYTSTDDLIDRVSAQPLVQGQPINEKLVRGLVVGANVRLASLPELPTAAEAGLPEFEAQGWNGLFAPKGTPADVIAKLNMAVKAAVESEPVKKRFADLSTVAPDANEHAPEVLQQLVKRDVEKFSKLLADQKDLK